MVALLSFFLTLLTSPFRPMSRLEAENAALRHQLAVLQRELGGRVQFTNSDRLFFILLYRWFPSILNAITIIRPETVVRWHRAGLRRFPMLGREEEYMLAKRWREHADREAAHRLVTSHLRLVTKIYSH